MGGRFFFCLWVVWGVLLAGARFFLLVLGGVMGLAKVVEDA